MALQKEWRRGGERAHHPLFISHLIYHAPVEALVFALPRGLTIPVERERDVRDLSDGRVWPDAMPLCLGERERSCCQRCAPPISLFWVVTIIFSCTLTR